MALEGQAHLDDAPAEKDEANGADEAEDEGGQVADNGEGIAAGRAGGKCGHGGNGHNGERHHDSAVGAEAALDLTRDGEPLGVLLVRVLFVQGFHGSFPPIS